MKLKPLSLKSLHFEASEDIMNKFESQGLHIMTIKYWTLKVRWCQNVFMISLIISFVRFLPWKFIQTRYVPHSPGIIKTNHMSTGDFRLQKKSAKFFKGISNITYHNVLRFIIAFILKCNKESPVSLSINSNSENKYFQ